jgi:hypothetical protein
LTPRRSRWLGRLVLALASLGVSIAGARSAPPQAPSGDWLRYAGLLGEAVRLSLDGTGPEAERVRADLEALAAQSPASTSAMPVKVWVAPNGVITRADAPMLKDEAANDLQSLLVGRAIGEAPPKGLPFPIRLKVDLKPAPAEAGPNVIGDAPKRP